MSITHFTRRGLSAATLAALAVAVALPLVGCSQNTRGGGGANDRSESAGRFTEDGTGSRGMVRATSGDAEPQISKQMPQTIVLGKTLTYQISVSNPGDASMSGITVVEELPEGFEFESASPNAEVGENGRTLTFSLGELAAGKSQELRITGTPQQGGQLQACTTYEYDRGVCTVMTVVEPALRLVKEGPEQAGLCGPVTYTYVVSNPGKDPANGVSIYDKFPEGMTADGKQDVTLDVGTVAPGQEVRKTMQVTATKAGEMGSYALAKSQLEEVKSQQVRTTFIAPDLNVAVKADRSTEYVGKNARFAVTVENPGETASPQTRLNLALDGGEIMGVRSDGERRPPTGDGAFDVGALEAGQSRTFDVLVRRNEAGSVKLNAVAQSVCDGRDAALASAEAADNIEFEAVSSLGIEVVDKVDPVRVGENTVYEISVVNEGSAVDNNLVVTALLPEGLSFVSAEGHNPITTDGQNLAMGPVQSLAPGERVTWYVTAKAATATGATKFTVNAKSDNIEQVVVEEPTRLY